MSAHQQRQQQQQLQPRSERAAAGGARARLGGVGYHCIASLLNFLLLLFIDFVRMHNQQTQQSQAKPRDAARCGCNCQNARLPWLDWLSRASGPQSQPRNEILHECVCVFVCVANASPGQASPLSAPLESSPVQAKRNQNFRW